LYAVGISPQKLARVMAMRAKGIDLRIITDNLDMAQAIAGSAAGGALPTLVEIDVDGHRAGLAYDDANALAAVAAALGVNFAGILTHAGGSYSLSDPQLLEQAAQSEMERAVHAADLLRRKGHVPGIVSIGSTPTGFSARCLADVTEFRAGVYVFCDLVMHGIGVCAKSDIALSVLTTVIGTYPDRGIAIVDAGWMALSRDRGTQEQAIDQGYGAVCDIDGNPLIDVLVTQANQEHGIIAIRSGSTARLPNFNVGDRLRILPNHACATAAQHARYAVVNSNSAEIVANWERFGGW
ncbi:MAG: alanine racemase, partial [Usitatibacteraceae bacterium]